MRDESGYKFGHYWPTMTEFSVVMVRVLPQGIISELTLKIEAKSMAEAELIADRQLGGDGWAPESFWQA